jgi:ABC-type uncharacterized transport system substrate-binding protein
MSAATGRGWFAQVGVSSSGASLIESSRRAAVYVDKILNGTKPADLPIIQLTRFELVLNLPTATALGLTISPRSSPEPTRSSNEPLKVLITLPEIVGP